MKNVVLAGALLASGLVALGAPIDGKWTVTTQGRQGDQTQTLTITSSGMTLKGTLDPGNGMLADIKEGMVMSADITFKVTRMGRNGDQTTIYKGTLSGDELKLTATREAAADGGGGGAKGGGGGGGGRGGPQELTFKRVK